MAQWRQNGLLFEEIDVEVANITGIFLILYVVRDLRSSG